MRFHKIGSNKCIVDFVSVSVSVSVSIVVVVDVVVVVVVVMMISETLFLPYFDRKYLTNKAWSTIYSAP